MDGPGGRAVVGRCHNGGEGFLDAVADNEHSFGDEGVFCAEVVYEEAGFAADGGGERSEGEVGDAVLEDVVDGGIEDFFAARG